MGTTAEVLATANAGAVTVEVTLPALLRIDVADNTNTIQQVTVPSWTGQATLQEFNQGRMRGYVVTPEFNKAYSLLKIKAGN
jgi:hypothetical protein